MTPTEQYKLQKNIRTVGLVVTVILILFFAFLVLREMQISFQNLIILFVLFVNLVYLIVKKPNAPIENPGEVTETKQS